MKTIGIIAEYNPFHNGHAYQIQKIRKQTGADYVIVAMSGDFVQRGAPAVMDKYARTRMALSCGADLVVELPVLWATASAEDFAMAGVSLFDKMGCVDGLCFGAETDDLPLLSAIADVLAAEPSEYREVLSSYIKSGLNFPQARMQALLLYLHNFAIEAPSSDLGNEVLPEVLSSPNNILALEYLKALRRRNSSMTPYLIRREGAGYHETSLLQADAGTLHTCAEKNDVPTVSPQHNAADHMICASATAIRSILLSDIKIPEGKSDTESALAESFIFSGNMDSLSFSTSADPLTVLSRAMPAEALAILLEYCRTYPLIGTDDFSSQLNYRLLLEGPCGFEHFFDSNTDISNRLHKNRYQFVSFEQFCELNKSRDITYTRMSRVLTHILLGLTKADAAFGKELDYIPYFRLLGFRRSSAPVLSAIKEAPRKAPGTASGIHASCGIASGTASDDKAPFGVPIISKLADAKNLLTGPALRMLEMDIFAGELYEQVLSYKKNSNTKKTVLPRSEYTREIVIL